MNMYERISLMRRTNKNSSLHYMIRKHFYITITIPIVVLASFFYLTQTITYQREKEHYLENTMGIIMSHVSSFIEYHQNMLMLFSDDPIIKNSLDTLTNMPENQDEVKASIDAVISRYDERYSVLGSMALGLENGMMFSKNAADLPVGYDPRVRPWYESISQSSQVFDISDPYVDALDPQRKSITLSQKVINMSGVFIGVAGLDVDMNEILELGNHLKLNENTAVLLVDSKGNLLASNGNRKLEDETEILSELNKHKKQILLEKELFKPYFVRNIEVYANQDEATGWWVVLYASNQMLRETQWTIIGLSMLLIVIFETLGSFYVKRLDHKLFSPLDRVVKSMEVFNFEHLDSEPRDIAGERGESSEVEKLRVVFNEMSQRLYEQHNDLAIRKAEIAHQYMEIEALYEETTAMNDSLGEMVDSLHDSWKQTIRALSNAIEANDEYTKGHCDRVKEYALAIAKAMEMDHASLEQIEFAALLHDIGKVAIPYHILNKEGMLTPEEREVIWRHPEVGHNIIEGVKFLEPVSKIILCHHECPDGSGYPYGKSLEDIPMSALILSVADAYDAMTSARSYRKIPLSKEQAFEELRKHSSSQFSEKIVDVAVKTLD